MLALILHDDVSWDSAAPDQVDALVQVETVRVALAEMGYSAVVMGLSMDLAQLVESVRQVRPHLVFNLVESLGGRGKLIHLAPAVLDTLGVPYTGSKIDAVYTTSNKVLAKKLMAGGGIPTPDWFSMADLRAGLVRPAGAYIIKSVWEHASLGIEAESVVSAESPKELLDHAIRRKDKLGGECFAEAYVEGREFNLSLLAGERGPEVLPPAEIVFDGFPSGGRKVVGYRAKWDAESFEYRHTPRCFDFPSADEPLLRRLKEIALRCWDLFGLRGYARVDFRVGRKSGPLVLEVNANPCLSPDAGFAAAADRAGLSFTKAVERIVGDALTS